jgi:hypothetical protein
LIKAYPSATTTLDPIIKKKKFNVKEWKPDSARGCRWMRKIALDFAATAHVSHAPDVLRLLPSPSRKAPLAWTDGLVVEQDELEQARLREERAEKKRAKAEKVAQAKAAKLVRKADKAAKGKPRPMEEASSPEFTTARSSVLA